MYSLAKYRTWAAVLLTALFVTREVLALDPERSFGQYRHQSWRIEQGLPQDTVTALLQARDGYLWAGTQTGLARFDGVSFEVFDSTRILGLETDWFTSLLEDRRGSIWAGTFGGGVVRFALGKWTVFTTGDGLPSGTITLLAQDSHDRIWAGTRAGLALFGDGRFSQVPLPQGLENLTINTLVPEPGGAVLVGTAAGTFRLGKGKAERLELIEGEDTRAILRGKDSLWFALPGFIVEANHEGTLVKNRWPVPFRLSVSLVEDRNGNLFAGSNTHGMARINRKGLTLIPQTAGAPDRVINCLMEDRDGTLWAGTHTEGLHSYSDSSFISYSEADGLTSVPVWSISQDGDGVLWAGTGNGLYRLDGERFRPLAPSVGRAPRSVLSLARTPAGALMTGGWAGEVNVLSPGGHSVEPLCDSQTGDGRSDIGTVMALLSVAEETVFAATSHGLFKIEGPAVTRVSEIPDTALSSIAADGAGGFYLGTLGNGVLHLREGKVQRFGKEQGLPHNRVTALLASRRGTLWAGTDRGLAVLSGDRAVPLRGGGLPVRAVMTIEEDRDGFLWLGTLRGLYRVNSQDLVDLAQGKVFAPRLRVFDTSDGLTSAEASGGGQPGSYCARDGRLWFATTRGLSVVDPGRLAEEVHPNLDLLSIRVFADGRLLDEPGPLTLDESPSRLEFRLSLPVFRQPGKIQFQTFLEGFDKEWGDAGRDRDASYTALMPGSYSFRARAFHEDWPAVTNEVRVNFEILPRLTQTKGFAAGLVFAVVFAAYLLIRLIVYKVRKERLVELLSTREKLRTLSRAVDQSASSIVITSLDGKIEFVNPAFFRATGYTEREVMGQNPRMLKSGVHNKEFYDAMWQTIQDGHDWFGEVCNRRKDGSLVWEYTTISPVRRDTGVISHFVAVKEDITARKKAEEALEEARAAAEASNRARAQFLANMSHEIRTPMNAVIGLTNVLLATPLSHRQQEYVHLLQSSGRHLLNIINDILDFSKLEAGKMKFEEVPVNLRGSLLEIRNILAPAFAEKKLELILSVADDVPEEIVADPGRLRQVLLNLLGNAAKFTEKGSVAVRVLREHLPAGAESLRFSVEDTGIGIPKEKLPSLFTAFSQVDGSLRRQHGGTGLGLAISREIVTQMGGTIGADSELGKGSVFWFLVPFREPVPSEDSSLQKTEEERGQRRPGGLDPKKGTSRVLLAEDNPVNRIVATAILERLGYSVKSVENGIQAIDALVSEDFDIVMMDVQMPEMDGLEATRLIRSPLSSARNPQIPIIALTAQVMEGDRERCLSAGMNAYLSKPFDTDVLAATLAGFLPENGRDEKASSSEVFDAGGFLSRFGGNEAAARKALGRFCKDFPRRLEALRDAASRNDREVIASVALSVKSSAANLGAAGIERAATLIETAALDLPATSGLDAINGLDAAFVQLRDYLGSEGWLP